MLPMAQPTQPAEHAHTGSVREATYQLLAAYSKAVRRVSGLDHLPVELRAAPLN